MVNNNPNNNKIQMQELLSKIQKVSNDKFESLCEQIFEILGESKYCSLFFFLRSYSFIIFNQIGKHKTHERHFKESFIEQLVDLYLQTFSDRVFKILVGISSPLDEVMFFLY